MTENMISETAETVTFEDIVSEIVGDLEEYTPYKIASIVNKIFTVTETDKQVPPQMMYNYDRNGMINKIKSAKRYNRDEVVAFVTKYTSKHVQA